MSNPPIDSHPTQQDTPTNPTTNTTNTTNTTEATPEKILCPYCKRTATNGIKCKGACVADAS
jgi:hypothetical protein